MRDTSPFPFLVRCLLLIGFVYLASADGFLWAAPSRQTDKTSEAGLTKSLNEFYSLKKSNLPAAKEKLEKILSKYPNNPTAHLEMGYLLINEGKSAEAIPHFKAAQSQRPNDPQISMQLGYLLDSTKEQKETYQQFEKAYTDSKDDKTREAACLAMINLAPSLLKVWPEPYFSDIYFSPSYSSRFDNALFALNMRAGANLGRRKEWDLYAGFRGTRDTESRGGTAPQIFSDNAMIFSLGVKYIPFQPIPLSLYAEAGRGYDLTRRPRKRWRDDFRAGALYYQTWGATPACAPRWEFPFKHIGNLYADVGYYSRYDRNWIGYARIREGFRVAQRHRSAVDAYLHVWGAADENHEFFNNLVEWGPGVAFIPDHRWNLVFRFVTLRGTYLKVDSPSVNPYSRHYTDNRIEAETYWRF